MTGNEFVPNIICILLYFILFLFNFVKKWSDLKRNVEEKAAKIRSFYRATGGGEASKEKLSKLEERIVGIIGGIMIEGYKRVH